MRYVFMRFPEGKAKAVTLSYDDGCPEDIRFSDTISKAGLKCTFNLNSDKMRETSLSKDEIETYFLRGGHEIAIHGANHRANGTLRPIEGIRDILDCRIELEQRFGIIVRGMAYPDTGITHFANGATYNDIKSYLKQLDIAYARTLFGDNNLFELPTDWHAWVPTAHHENPKLMQYVDEFVNLDLSLNLYKPYRTPRLFYLWGHSYEFERGNNWQLLDDICRQLAGHSDIWYATNIEIYDYLNAYNHLVYSADGSIIYNPTLIDIWLDIDGEIIKVSSAETVKI